MTTKRLLLPFVALTHCLAAVLPAQGTSAPAEPKVMTFDDLVTRRARYAVGSPEVRWVADGTLLEIRDAAARSGKVRPTVRDPRTWQPAEVPAAGPEAGAENAAGARTGRRRTVDASAPRVTVDAVSGQVVFDAPDQARRVLTSGEAARREAHLSPNGTHASYVENNDLFVCDIARGEAWRVTKDGGTQWFHGVLDWVYQEEVYGRGKFQAHWWSSDGARVAFLSLDQRDVRTFTLVDHVPTPSLDEDRGVAVEVSSYPKAGDPNPVAHLSVADVAGQTVHKFDLGRFPKDLLVVRVGWTPAGDRVVFQVQDRVQTWLELCVGDPTTGAVTTLIREESPTWVNVLEMPEWLDDGTFLWWSERSGNKHLYHYRADGELIAQVTHGDFPVREVLRRDDASGVLWFTASPEYPSDQHVFRTTLAGDAQVQLTKGRGRHSVSLNHDGSMFVDRVSTVASPPEVRVCSGDGEVQQTLPSTQVESDYVFCPTELHVVPARDGHPLEVTLIKPVFFDPAGGPYPVWIETYSGPAAPSVRNSWNVQPWEQFLAHQGIIVLQVNVRTASEAGQVVIGKCHKQFCVQELADLEDAVRWLTAEPWADANRVGITGWSYGGTMTAYALTHSDLFRVGIAGAGVYDWRLYDTIYTERYMDTPQANPAGYAKSSCIESAKDLRGYLVLVHGTMDDNVHLQNTIRFAGELQRFGKDFEMMLYPKSRHGVRSPHLMSLRWKIIRRELLGA